MSDRLAPEHRKPIYSDEDVIAALEGALDEQARDRRTSVWDSFFDRLTQGGPIPDRGQAMARREQV